MAACAAFYKESRIWSFYIFPGRSVFANMQPPMQFIKGGFSYRLKREFGYLGEVWQRGFSEPRVEDRESYVRHREYIAQKPREGRIGGLTGKVSLLLHLSGKTKAGRG